MGRVFVEDVEEPAYKCRFVKQVSEFLLISSLGLIFQTFLFIFRGLIRLFKDKPSLISFLRNRLHEPEESSDDEV